MVYCILQPLKWELKQKPGGISPPRGGYNKDDPNQQIIAEDIFDEYGGMKSPLSIFHEGYCYLYLILIQSRYDGNLIFLKS